MTERVWTKRLAAVTAKTMLLVLLVLVGRTHAFVAVVSKPFSSRASFLTVPAATPVLVARTASVVTTKLPMLLNSNNSHNKCNLKPKSFFPFDVEDMEERTLANEKERADKALYMASSSSSSNVGGGGIGGKEYEDGKVRQLLGIRGASAETNIWKIRLQLTKPVTWIPLIFGVMCGAAASGNYHWMWNPLDPTDRDVMLGLSDAAKGLATIILAGPFMTGFTQTINDWYDRDIDAINEPYRPIPSGSISKGQVIFQIWFLFLSSLAIAYGLDKWVGHDDVPSVLLLSILGSFIAYIYSAPPLKLKQNGWIGNYAVGASYISLPWWCGQAVFGNLDRPVYFILPILYSIGGLGIAIVNDFKSIEGDRALGLQSLPVAFGVDTAKWICAGSVTLTQLGVAAYLYSINEPLYGSILLSLILPQVYFLATLLLPDPIQNDVKYQASSQPFFALGILVTALCLGHHDFGN